MNFTGSEISNTVVQYTTSGEVAEAGTGFEPQQMNQTFNLDIKKTNEVKIVNKLSAC